MPAARRSSRTLRSQSSDGGASTSKAARSGAAAGPSKVARARFWFHCFRALVVAFAGLFMVFQPDAFAGSELGIRGYSDLAADAHVRAGIQSFLRIIGNSALFVSAAHAMCAYAGDRGKSLMILRLDVLLMSGEVLGMFLSGFGMAEIGVPMASLLVAAVLVGSSVGAVDD